MKSYHVVPWYKGRWKVVGSVFAYIVWRVSWFIYYPFTKNKYNWE